MEIVPKEIISFDNTQKLETPDLSCNFISEVENELCYEELLIEALKIESSSQCEELNYGEILDEQEDNKNYTQEIKIDPNIVHYVNKVLEINEVDIEYMMKYALSFLLFIGVTEKKDVIFKVLEEFEVQKELKEIFEVSHISPEMDYLTMSQKAFQN